MSHPKLYRISTATMMAGIEKLNLQKGDILVVSHHETIAYLEGLGRVTEFPVPVVFAPQGIKKLSRQDLLNLLEQLDQSLAPTPPAMEAFSAPL